LPVGAQRGSAISARRFFARASSVRFVGDGLALQTTWSGTPGSNLNAIRVAAADLAAFVAAQRSRYEGLRPSVAHSSVPESRDM